MDTDQQKRIDALAQQFCDELTTMITKQEPAPETITALMFAFAWALIALGGAAGEGEAYGLALKVLRRVQAMREEVIKREGEKTDETNAANATNT